MCIGARRVFLLLLCAAGAALLMGASADGDISIGVILQSLAAGLVAVVAWTFRTFRRETRESMHELRNQLQTLLPRVAVMEALQRDRNSTLEVIREILDRIRKGS